MIVIISPSLKDPESFRMNSQFHRMSHIMFIEFNLHLHEHQLPGAQVNAVMCPLMPKFWLPAHPGQDITCQDILLMLAFLFLEMF